MGVNLFSYCDSKEDSWSIMEAILQDEPVGCDENQDALFFAELDLESLFLDECGLLKLF